jgi:multiple sugar transport system ATP-binding protein
MFVAGFIGSPAMNLLEGGLSQDLSSLVLGSQRIELSNEVLRQRPGLMRYGGRSIVVGVRPEDLHVVSVESSDVVLGGNVELVEALGAELLLHFSLDARIVRAEGLVIAESEEPSDHAEPGDVEDCVARVEPSYIVRVGERINFSLSPERLEFFDLDSSVAIWD